jgi:ribonuclease HI
MAVFLDIYTDGSVRKQNDSFDGTCGFVMIEYEEIKSTYTAYKENTTIMEMELLALKYAVDIVKLANYSEKYELITFFSDSKVAVTGINNYCKKWSLNGWVKSNRQQVENWELYKELYDFFSNSPSSIKLEYIKAHQKSSNWNNYIDELIKEKYPK